MLRCSICRRPLLRCAVPGLQIGPKCAKDRDLLPARVRIRRVEVERDADQRQIDWVKALDAEPPLLIIPERPLHFQGPHEHID